MKKILFIIVSFLTGSLFAQTQNDYLEIQKATLKAEKKAIVLENMTFTEEESKLFWPVYDEYNQKLFDIRSKEYELILEYADSIDVVTDDFANKLMTELHKLQTQALNLKKSYYKKFLKTLPASKVMRYYQIESKISAILRFELAMEIPLVELKE